MGRLVKHPPMAQNVSSAYSSQLAAGATSTRPDVTQAGEMRFNITTGALEYYDGTIWSQIAPTGLTPIVQESFTGDAIETDFTMTDRTVAAVTDILVFVGGVFQNPATAYTIITAGTEVSFTSPPPNLEPIVVLHGFNEVV